MALTAHALTTTPGPNYIDLEWTLHDSERNAQVYYDLGADVWASETSNFEDAELIGEGVTSFRHNALPAGAQRWYWVQAKYLDESPASGGFFPDADTSPPAEGIPGEELTGQIGPMTVTDLKTFSGIGHIFLKWTLDDPTEEKNGELGFDYVEVWASADNDFDNATLVTTGDKFGAGHFALAAQATFFYWVRAINKAGVPGEYFPEASPNEGIEGSTTIIAPDETGVPVPGTIWTVFSDFDVSATGGTITSVTNKRGLWIRAGGLVVFTFNFTVATNGTGAGEIEVELPVYAWNNQQPVGAVQINKNGNGLTGIVDIIAGGGPATTVCKIIDYEANYPAIDNTVIRGTLIYGGVA